jgi:DNA-binding NarL/FixJ family response regulator
MYSILVIEDDPTIRSNIELILQMEGFVVHTACDGSEGLAKVPGKHPDLILCDILMPGMNGHMLLEELKSESSLADIPFIFITALAERADVRRGMTAGADDYLTKPFSADELIAAVTGRIQRHSTIRLHSLKTSFQKEHAILRQKITSREQEVLKMVGHGATSKEIADTFGISLRTVEVHRSNLMRKLNANNAALLTRWAVIAEQI